MRIFSQEIRYLGRKHNGRLVATLPEYAEINQLDLARGRFLIKDDNDGMKNVAVLAASYRGQVVSVRGSGRTIGQGGQLFLPCHRGPPTANADRRQRRQPGG